MLNCLELQEMFELDELCQSQNGHKQSYCYIQIQFVYLDAKEKYFLKKKKKRFSFQKLYLMTLGYNKARRLTSRSNP